MLSFSSIKDEDLVWLIQQFSGVRTEEMLRYWKEFRREYVIFEIFRALNNADRYLVADFISVLEVLGQFDIVNLLLNRPRRRRYKFCVLL